MAQLPLVLVYHGPLQIATFCNFFFGGGGQLAKNDADPSLITPVRPYPSPVAPPLRSSLPVKMDGGISHDGSMGLVPSIR